MFVEDFTLNKDDQGTQYVTFEENPTKTRQGGLRKKRRAIQPEMFATGGCRCPVQFVCPARASSLCPRQIHLAAGKGIIFSLQFALSKSFCPRQTHILAWGPFLEGPENFSHPKTAMAKSRPV